MILVNLIGGPGAGKTTMSFYLAYYLKKHGILAELVGEQARERIYNSTYGVVPPPLMDNQVLIAGEQYERVCRLFRHRIEVAISDSPVTMGLMYCKQAHYWNELSELLHKLEINFETYNVLIRRTPGNYNAESRLQKTEAEALAFDEEAKKIFADRIWLEIGWDQEKELGLKLLELAIGKRLKPFAAAQVLPQTR